MIGLLNILPYLVAGLGFYAAYRYRSIKVAIGVVLAIALYNHFQPSYVPKGEAPRAHFEAPVASDKPIVDRMLKPKSSEEYDAKRQAEYDKIDKRIYRVEQ